MTERPPIKKKEAIGQTLWWILVIALCLWGALEFAKGYALAGLMFIAAAAMAMPPVRAWMRNLTGPRAPGWVFSTLPFMLLVVASVNSGPAGLPEPRPVTSTPSNEATAATTEPIDVVANIVRYQGGYIGASQACKNAFQAIADGGQSSNTSLQTMYNLAGEARDQCRASRAAIGRLERPKGLTSEGAGAFSAASRTCDMAYLFAQQTAEKLMKATDNGMRPSLVAEYQTTAGYAVGGRQACEKEIAHAAEAGVIAHRSEAATP